MKTFKTKAEMEKSFTEAIKEAHFLGVAKFTSEELERVEALMTLWLKIVFEEA